MARSKKNKNKNKNKIAAAAASGNGPKSPGTATPKVAPKGKKAKKSRQNAGGNGSIAKGRHRTFLPDLLPPTDTGLRSTAYAFNAGLLISALTFAWIDKNPRIAVHSAGEHVIPYELLAASMPDLVRFARDNSRLPVMFAAWDKDRKAAVMQDMMLDGAAKIMWRKKWEKSQLEQAIRRHFKDHREGIVQAFGGFQTTPMLIEVGQAQYRRGKKVGQQWIVNQAARKEPFVQVVPPPVVAATAPTASLPPRSVPLLPFGSPVQSLKHLENPERYQQPFAHHAPATPLKNTRPTQPRPLMAPETTTLSSSSSCGSDSSSSNSSDSSSDSSSSSSSDSDSDSDSDADPGVQGTQSCMDVDLIPPLDLLHSSPPRFLRPSLSPRRLPIGSPPPPFPAVLNHCPAADNDSKRHYSSDNSTSDSSSDSDSESDSDLDTEMVSTRTASAHPLPAPLRRPAHTPPPRTSAQPTRTGGYDSDNESIHIDSTTDDETDQLASDTDSSAPPPLPAPRLIHPPASALPLPAKSKTAWYAPTMAFNRAIALNAIVFAWAEARAAIGDRVPVPHVSQLAQFKEFVGELVAYARASLHVMVPYVLVCAEGVKGSEQRLADIVFTLFGKQKWAERLAASGGGGAFREHFEKLFGAKEVTVPAGNLRVCPIVVRDKDEREERWVIHWAAREDPYSKMTAETPQEKADKADVVKLRSRSTQTLALPKKRASEVVIVDSSNDSSNDENDGEHAAPGPSKRPRISDLMSQPSVYSGDDHDHFARPHSRPPAASSSSSSSTTSSARSAPTSTSSAAESGQDLRSRAQISMYRIQLQQSHTWATAAWYKHLQSTALVYGEQMSLELLRRASQWTADQRPELEEEAIRLVQQVLAYDIVRRIDPNVEFEYVEAVMDVAREMGMEVNRENLEACAKMLLDE